MVRYINENLLKGYKFIIAPHQIDAHRIEQLKIKFIVQATLFSELSETNFAATEVLLIDNIGILSSLYSYGDMAYIGGGFNAGVHNVLEAAVHSMPILFGPHYFKSLEAIELKNNFAAFPVSNYQEFKNTLNDLTEGDQRRYMYASLRSKQYGKAHLGGAEVVSDYINHVFLIKPK